MQTTPAHLEGEESLAGLLAFDPVPMERHRRRGWTEERQYAFIVALARYGVVADAARAVGMSARSAYHLRLKPGADGFDAAWARAQEEAVLDRRTAVIDRALNGDPALVIRGGRCVGVRRNLSLGKQLRIFVALGREHDTRASRRETAQDRQWHRDCAANRKAIEKADREAFKEAERQQRAAEQWLDEAREKRKASRGDGARVRRL